MCSWELEIVRASSTKKGRWPKRKKVVSDATKDKTKSGGQSNLVQILEEILEISKHPDADPSHPAP